MLETTIIDSGIGISEDRQKLLEPYMTTRQKGTGLGLAIVRKILEDHGGSIELMDAPSVSTGGRGAMMRLRIPLFENEETAVLEEQGSEVENGAKSSTKGDGSSLHTPDPITENMTTKEATS